MVTVSVLMPVFNEARYLSAAMESILDQTFVDFEFLVLDDGSTDATPDILEKYARRDDRVRVVSRSNRGLVASLNELLGHAKGRFIARMDGDDISLPQRFSRQVRFLDDHADVVCVGGDVEVIDESGRFLTIWEYSRKDEHIQERQVEGRSGICHGAAMMRREALIGIGGYHAEYELAEDLDASLRLGEIGKLANLGEVIYKFRLHSDSVSGQNGPAQHQAARAACERAWRRRGIHGVFTAAPEWRPGPDRRSRYHYMLLYGSWAWASRQRRTAAIYAVRAIGQHPVAKGGWGLLARTLFSPLAKKR